MAAPKTDMDKLKELSAKPYKQQAVWFLNAFWATGPAFGTEDVEGAAKDGDAADDKAEKVWKYCQKVIEIDAKRGEAGSELNEFDAHRLLEAFDATLTVRKMREVLQEIDLDFDKKVSLTEFLIYKFAVDWKVLVNAPQGGEDQEAVQAAAAKVEEARARALASRAEEAAAAKKEAEAKEAEAESAKAKAVADAALAELTKQEEALAARKTKLTETGENMEFGVVKRNKAKVELAQLEAEDPLPLRQAKITQEAAVRKLQKALKKASASAAAAGAARKIAKAAAEAAEKAMDEAALALEEIKAQIKDAGAGQLWWLDRELIDAMQYMPQRKRAEMEKKLAASRAARAEAQAA